MRENTDQNNSEYGHFFTQCLKLSEELVKGMVLQKYISIAIYNIVLS